MFTYLELGSIPMGDVTSMKFLPEFLGRSLTWVKDFLRKHFYDNNK